MSFPIPTATPSPSPSTSSPSDASAPETCSACESKDAWVIHTVRSRGVIRTFCTHCLLRNHPVSFCPACFSVYDPSSPPHPSRRVTCSKCVSMTHTHCFTGANSSTYLCPPCRNPDTFSFFRPIVRADGVRIVDQHLSLVFLCAAKIASASMNKAVHLVKTDSERRGREAALARKRAREQLEDVLLIDGKEKARTVGGGGAAGGTKVKEAYVEQKPKLLNGGAVKETESVVKNNGGGGEKQSHGLQLAKVKQEGGDVSK